MVRYFITLLCVLAVTTSFAQSKKKKKSETQSSGQPSSLSPYYPQEEKAPQKKKSSGKVTYNAEQKYYDRVEAIAKQERKNEKEMEKPENSDPLYFGHKKPPKKRPPHKMKYCKVCGIRH